MNTVEPSPVGTPRINPPVHQSIPDLLQRQQRWVAWRPGPYKENGKFNKYPVDPQTGKAINANDPINWMSFGDALAVCGRGAAAGIGIVLSDQHPIVIEGAPFYLVAVDLDHCRDAMNEHKQTWIALGRPYVEVSPSGEGLRMLGFSAEPIRGGNAGGGRELYSTGRFMTITGAEARGDLRNITAELRASTTSGLACGLQKVQAPFRRRPSQYPKIARTLRRSCRC